MKKTLIITGISLVALVGMFEGYQLATESTMFTSAAAQLLFSDNLHEVTPGRLLRAAEMPSERLRETIEKFGIKTVVDLRYGEPDADKDAKLEPQVVKELGAKYEHVPLLGSKLPSKRKLLRLLKIYESAEKPILVHCSSGTHRSGVAAAVWLLAEEHAPFDAAAEQLSAKYGYFRIERRLKALFYSHPTIDQLLWDYGEAQKASGVDFVTWVKRSYRPKKS